MADVLRTKTVKTRKPHRCFGCRETIPTGTIVEVSTIVDDGIYDTYLCEVCTEWIENHNCGDYGDGGGIFYEGDIGEARREEMLDKKRRGEKGGI